MTQAIHPKHSCRPTTSRIALTPPTMTIHEKMAQEPTKFKVLTWQIKIHSNLNVDHVSPIETYSHDIWGGGPVVRSTSVL